MNSEDADLLDYEDQGEDEVDGCLHGIPWCEECPWCEDDVDDYYS